MSKKIALLIIMVMLANMAVWADDDIVIVGVAIALGTGLVVGLIFLLIEGVAEADKPDDGIRLASMQTADTESKTESKTTSGTVLNLIQHVEVGQTQDNKFYAGLRFRF
jgi:hypothetical protein